MPLQHYKNAQTVDLDSLIPVDYFRLVDTKEYNVPCGMTEIPVEIELHDVFLKSLSFTAPWDGILYGFTKEFGKIKELNGRQEFNHRINRICLQDWDDKFLLVIERDFKEIAYYVPTPDVKALLENCRKPNNKYDF